MIRIGHGYDVHRLVEHRALVLGGVEIPWDCGLDGHSDADVLLHAVTDAVLGALCLGDLGEYFPDTDPAYENLSSVSMLRQVLDASPANEWSLLNLDCTVIAQRPRLSPYITDIRASIAEVFQSDPGRVSVKATTTEGIGGFGRGEGMAAHAVLLMTRRSRGE